MRKIVDTILPTTMVGSYPRPGWFTYQLLGRDPRVAFKHAPHEEAYADATRVISPPFSRLACTSRRSAQLPSRVSPLNS